MLKIILISMLLTSCVCGCSSTDKELRSMREIEVLDQSQEGTGLYSDEIEIAGEWFLINYFRIDNMEKYYEDPMNPYWVPHISADIGRVLYRMNEKPLENTSGYVFRFMSAAIVSVGDRDILCRVEYNKNKTRGKIVLKFVDDKDDTRYKVYTERLTEEQIKRFEENFNIESFPTEDIGYKDSGVDDGSFDGIEYIHEDDYRVFFKDNQYGMTPYFGAAYDLCTEVFDYLDNSDYSFLQPVDYYNR